MGTLTAVAVLFQTDKDNSHLHYKWHATHRRPLLPAAAAVARPLNVSSGPQCAAQQSVVLSAEPLKKKRRKRRRRRLSLRAAPTVPRWPSASCATATCPRAS